MTPRDLALIELIERTELTGRGLALMPDDLRHLAELLRDLQSEARGGEWAFEVCA